MSGGDWKDMYAAAVAGNLALVRHHIGAGVNPNYQHPAGALVEPVHGVDMLSQLVTQGLHHKPRLARVQPRAVHQPACGLVQGHQVLVAPEDVQGRGHERSRCRGTGRGRQGKARIVPHGVVPRLVGLNR